MSENGLRPGLSAVLCCYNSAAVIEPTIRALAEQRLPEKAGYEVILVDNGCTDDTVERAKKAWEDAPSPLRVVRENVLGLIRARRRGTMSARYDVALFVDDDNVLAPDWVVKIRDCFQAMPKVGIIGGNNTADIQGEKPEWFDRFQSMYACGPRAEKAGLNPQKNFGAGLAFRTALVQSDLSSPLPFFLTGRTGSTPALGEDSEMVMRCQLSGWDFFYEPSLLLRHRILEKRLRWNYLIALATEGGKAWIVLQIYQCLREKKNPPTHRRLLLDIAGRWRDYVNKHKWKSLSKGREGAWRSIGRARLIGMSKGWREYGKAYPRMRRQIINHSWGHP